MSAGYPVSGLQHAEHARIVVALAVLHQQSLAVLAYWKLFILLTLR